jgi:hypothetical protein
LRFRFAPSSARATRSACSSSASCSRLREALHVGLVDAVARHRAGAASSAPIAALAERVPRRAAAPRAYRAKLIARGAAIEKLQRERAERPRSRSRPSSASHCRAEADRIIFGIVEETEEVKENIGIEFVIL